MIGFFTRGTGFLLLGGLLGHFATKLRSALDTVNRREQQLQAILDNSTAMVCAQGHGRPLHARQPQVRGALQAEAGEIAGKTDHDVFPATWPTPSARTTGGSSRSAARSSSRRPRPDDNGPHTYLAIKFPLLDDAGYPYCVCVMATDITNRKEAEKQLKESKDRFRQILDTAQEAFVAMNGAGEITGWNRAAEETFGWPSEKVMGRQLAEVIVPERYREAHSRGIEKFLKTGKGPIMNKRIELMALHRDGREFPVEMTVSPVRVRGGFIFNAFMHDISERKQVEQEVVKLSTVTGTGNGAGNGADPS